MSRTEHPGKKGQKRFSLAEFGWEVVTGVVMGGLASAAFYGAGKAVEAVKNSVRSVYEGGTRHGYSVDSFMFPDDEAAGVLRNGEYVKNPTAHSINDYISEGSNYLGSKK